jgi:hypothetical protein
VPECDAVVEGQRNERNKSETAGPMGMHRTAGRILGHIWSRGPVSSKILWAGVATYKTLQFKARADLILGRAEYGQCIHEEPVAERRQGELVPDDLGQQNSEVKFVPEREELAGLEWMRRQ